MRAVIIRKRFRRQQTTGSFIVYGDNGLVDFYCKTLELDVDGNKEGESCIPDGEYDLVPLTDRPDSVTFSEQKQGYFPYLITPVKGRSGILLHHGNFHTDILGCVLPGKELIDIDGDGLKDVTSSRDTMKEINDHIKTTIPLTVKRSNIDRGGIENAYVSNWRD